MLPVYYSVSISLDFQLYLLLNVPASVGFCRFHTKHMRVHPVHVDVIYILAISFMYLLVIKVIVNNRRLQYEERASASPLDYDNWFDYLRLEESAGDLDKAREVRSSVVGSGTASRVASRTIGACNFRGVGE